MKILLVSATTFEITPTLLFLEKEAEQKTMLDYHYRGHYIYPLVTGVGSFNTTFALARQQDLASYDVVINIGVAGTFDLGQKLGGVVEIEKDRFADLGVEAADGEFTDVFEMELIDPNRYPHKGGWVENKKMKMDLALAKVVGVTVNKVTGTSDSIEAIQNKYGADIETMEGAAFLYTCAMMDVKHHAVRAISNHVEPRNRNNWQLDRAIDAVNDWFIKLISELDEAVA